MKVSIKRKNGEDIDFERAYEVYGRGQHDETVAVVFPNELDHNVESVMEYSTDKIEWIEITF